MLIFGLQVVNHLLSVLYSSDRLGPSFITEPIPIFQLCFDVLFSLCQLYTYMQEKPLIFLISFNVASLISISLFLFCSVPSRWTCPSMVYKERYDPNSPCPLCSSINVSKNVFNQSDSAAFRSPSSRSAKLDNCQFSALVLLSGQCED